MRRNEVNNAVAILLLTPLLWVDIRLGVILIVPLLYNFWDLGAHLSIANAISVIRVILLFLTFYLVTSGYAIWVFVIVSSVNIIILDVLDGWIARKREDTSVAGAFIDMETDSLQVYLTSVILLQFIGYWLIIPAVLRYVYVILIRGFENVSVQSSTMTKLIGSTSSSVLVFSLLLLGKCPVYVTIIDGIITVLLIYSFSSSYFRVRSVNS